MSSRLQNQLAAVGRIGVLLMTYAAVIVVSLLLAFLLRFDFQPPADHWSRFWNSLAWILPLKLLLLAAFGQFRALLTYFSLPDAKRIAGAVAVAAVIELIAWFFLEGSGVIVRGVILTDMVISFLALAGLRTGLRVYREKLSADAAAGGGKRRRTAILGAGASGAALLRDIQSRQGLGLEVVCFVDDDRAKIGGNLHGKPVVGPLRRLAAITEDFALQKVVIAMPNAKPPVVRQLVARINEIGLDHDILPSVPQLLHRQVTVSHLRRVEAEDLLGREPVALDEDGITRLVRGEVVMVTGAGGSIGSELCRQLAGQDPARLVLVERSEPALFAIEQELLASHRHVGLVPSACSVCDAEQMELLFARHRPGLVFHAAAHKHVPLMERQPGEALRNNVVGTAIVARLAAAHGTRKFVLISTDKAVNPTSVMGATKRLAEMVVQDHQTQGGHGCAFTAVRFGNVLGSSGSVVPIFRRQIAEGGPLTVTHPEVTRYFMSIPEAVGLILQSALQASGGEIFVLDMGEPVKIADLARQMIELSGFVAGEDIKIQFTGLRPGEKLYEEPIHEMENVEPTVHPKVRVLRDMRGGPAVGIVAELDALRQELVLDADRLREWMAAKIPEYAGGGRS